MKRTWGIVAVIIIVLVALFLIYNKAEAPAATSEAPRGPPSGQTLITTVSYACEAGKGISAAYYQGAATSAPAADQPPTPNGSVVVTLSDGRSMTLKQTISADGNRYANADESIVFWSKGPNLTFTENGQPTYSGCAQAAAGSAGLPQTYQSAARKFSISYPANYVVDDKYSYQELGPGKSIGGVKFTIDPAIAAGTNLSTDSYVSVEQLPKASSCSADLFLDSGAASGTPMTMREGNATYSMFSSSGAGAGNRYDETVYAIPGTSPCTAVRYFIHYGAIENYPAGSVKQFDEAALKSQFDAIRRSLSLNA